jgi:hypothetical protein
MTRRKLIRCGSIVAVLGCLVGIGAYQLLGPWYEGRPLGYGVDRLEPAPLQSPRWKPTKQAWEFRNLAAGTSWEAERTEMHKRSSRVLKHAGRECLPVLLSRLTAPAQPARMAFVGPWRLRLQRWAYNLRVVDHVPTADSDFSQERRGQAVRAIVLIGDRAAPLIPQLSALAARGDDDNPVTVAASMALWRIAPDEFRRVRSSQFNPSPTMMAREADSAANGRRPIRSQTNTTSAAGGSRR